MRTTVDLPKRTHDRVRELAAARGVSLSAVIADLTQRGLNELDGRPRYRIDERTGLPVIHTGRPITVEEVAALIDEDE